MPKITAGTAAMRSIVVTMKRCRRRGAYSVTSKAVRIEIGTPITRPIRAMITVPIITAPTPDTWSTPSVFHSNRVRNVHTPFSWNAGSARINRNAPISTRITNVVNPAPVATAR